jgi:hypothetical protein
LVKGKASEVEQNMTLRNSDAKVEIKDDWLKVHMGQLSI